jgi:hypothetical protein
MIKIIFKIWIVAEFDVYLLADKDEAFYRFIGGWHLTLQDLWKTAHGAMRLLSRLAAPSLLTLDKGSELPLFSLNRSLRDSQSELSSPLAVPTVDYRRPLSRLDQTYEYDGSRCSIGWTIALNHNGLKRFLFCMSVF